MEIVFLLAAVVSLACYIWVLTALFLQKNLLWGLFGLLCCHIYVLLFGFFEWESKHKKPVMLAWALTLIAQIALRAQLDHHLRY